MNAVILRGGRVVRTTNLSNISYYFSGFAASFEINSVKYRYCSIDDTRNEKHADGFAVGGYYPESAYLEYVDNIITLDALIKQKEYRKFESAQAGDIISAWMLFIDDPAYNQKLELAEYKWAYIIDEKIDGGNRVVVPPRAITPANFSQIQVHSTALTFLTNKLPIINSPGVADDKRGASYYLNCIAWYIEKIVVDLFPYFEYDPDFSAYITAQKLEWETKQIFYTPTYKEIYAYYESIKNVHKKLWLFRRTINEVEDINKLTKLALSLSAASLSIIPAQSRLNILWDLVSTSLSEWIEMDAEENLVVRIIQSFETENITNVNYILDCLIALPKKLDNSNEPRQTLYEILYDRMSRDWAIKEAGWGFLNWAFNGSWEPEDTRGNFVKAVYVLWVLSDYNPYDFETSLLKPNSIGFRKKVGGAYWYETDDTDNNGDPVYTLSSTGCKHYYTRYRAYTVEELQTPPFQYLLYSVVHSEAANMILPYNSEKSGGIYFDNGEFKFNEDKIHYYVDLPQAGHVKDSPRRNVIYGSYNLFQPVNLCKENQETIMYLPFVHGKEIEGTNINSLIPIFMLHYVDNAGDNADFQTVLGIAFDVVMTLIPIGNLAKLRHLRHLSGLERVRVLIGAVEFSSGATSFMLNYIDACNNNTGFCENLKKFMFWMEIASLSADAITTKMARDSAKTIVDGGFPFNFDNILARTELENLAQFADEIGDASRYLSNHFDDIKNAILSRIKRNGGGLSGNHFRLNFPDDDLRQFIRECLALQLADPKTIADFISMACRSSKRSNYADLLVQVTYYKKVVLAKGFPSGFSSLADYKLFCNQVKDYLDGLGTNGFRYKQIRVQGSVLKVRDPLDPIDPNNIPYLKNSNGDMISPKDIDIDIIVTRSEAIKYVESTKMHLYSVLNSGTVTAAEAREIRKFISEMDKGIEKGLIKGMYMKEPFLENLRIAAKRGDGSNIFNPINERGFSEVNASLVIEKSDYDLMPNLEFKY